VRLDPAQVRAEADREEEELLIAQLHPDRSAGDHDGRNALVGHHDVVEDAAAVEDVHVGAGVDHGSRVGGVGVVVEDPERVDVLAGAAAQDPDPVDRVRILRRHGGELRGYGLVQDVDPRIAEGRPADEAVVLQEHELGLERPRLEDQQRDGYEEESGPFHRDFSGSSLRAFSRYTRFRTPGGRSIP
jgi:hypothetical protein